MDTKTEAAMQAMSNGNVFYIYINNTKAPVTMFYVPNDPDELGSFYWCGVGQMVRHESCKFPVSMLTDVYLGKQTPSFLRNAAAHHTPDNVCMSLCSSGLTLDLETVSEAVVTDWMHALNHVLSADGKEVVDEDAEPETAALTDNPSEDTAGGVETQETAAEAAEEAPLAAAAAVAAVDDEARRLAEEEAAAAKKEDGLRAIERGGVVVHYPAAAAPVLAFACHSQRAGEYTGALRAVPLIPVSGGGPNANAAGDEDAVCGHEARALHSLLGPGARDLLRSLARGEVAATDAVRDRLTALTQGLYQIGGAPFSASLDDMTDLFLGKQHADLAAHEDADPLCCFTIAGEDLAASFECPDKQVLFLWLQDVNAMLADAGTDVVATNEEEAAAEDEFDPDAVAPSRPTHAQTRRFTVLRSQAPTAADTPEPAAVAPAPVPVAAEGFLVPAAELHPLEQAVGAGLPVATFPHALPGTLRFDSARRELVLMPRGKSAELGRLPVAQVTGVTVGGTHGPLADCAFPARAVSLRGPGLEWHVCPESVEAAEALLQWLEAALNASARAVALQSSAAPGETRTFAVSPHAAPTPAPQRSARLCVSDDALAGALGEGRIFTGYAERNGQVLKNKLTMFYMPPDELLRIATSQPSAAPDPMRASKTKTAVGRVRPTTRGRLCWCSAGRRVPVRDSYLELGDITDVYVGKQTNLLATASRAPSERCFSVLSARDQLDLEADSAVAMFAWIEALQLVLLKAGRNVATPNAASSTASTASSATPEPAGATDTPSPTPAPAVDARVATGARGRRLSVMPPAAGKDAPSAADPEHAHAPASLLGAAEEPRAAAHAKTQLAPLTADVDSDPEQLLLERGARFVRYFTSQGKPSAQQLWVYYTAPVDAKKRTGSLRWLPLAAMAQALGLPKQDPAPASPGADVAIPTAWSTSVCESAAALPAAGLAASLRRAAELVAVSAPVVGANGVMRMGCVTDVYVGRTTASLKALVPQGLSKSCFSLVAKDKAGSQTVVSLRADSPATTTAWLRAIQHVIAARSGRSMVADADKPSTEAQATRRFTVKGPAPTLDGGDADKPRQRRLTVKATAAPPMAPPSSASAVIREEEPAAASPAADKPVATGRSRRFTVKANAAPVAAAAATKPVTILAAAAAAAASTPISPPSAAASPSAPSQVAAPVWDSIVASESVAVLLRGVEATVYCTPAQDLAALQCSAASCGGDVGVDTSDGHIVAKRALVYYARAGGKSGSLVLHPLPTEGPGHIEDSDYLAARAAAEPPKLSRGSHEAVPLHLLTDIMVGKGDPIWKRITSGTASSPAAPHASTVRSDTCLSVLSRRQQLHLVLAGKPVVKAAVEALQTIIAKCGKKVLYDQQQPKPAAAAALPTGTPGPRVQVLTAAGPVAARLSAHASSDALFIAATASNLAQETVCAPPLRSFDVSLDSTRTSPDPAPISSSDAAWRKAADTRGLLCIAHDDGSSVSWLPIAALAQLSLPPFAAAAVPPGAAAVLAWMLTGGQQHTLALAADDSAALVAWLQSHVTAKQPPSPPAPAPAPTPAPMDAGKRLARNTAFTQHLSDATDQPLTLWYEPQSHALMWVPAGQRRRVQYAEDGATPANVAYLDYLTDLYLGSTTEPLRRGARDEDACLTLCAERPSFTGGARTDIQLDLEAPSAAARDAWFDALQAVLSERGATIDMNQ